MPGFATSPERFLSDYAKLLRYNGNDPGEVANWLLTNTASITEAIFYNGKVDWAGFDPVHLMVLRACAPRNVFTPKAKAEYLEKVGKVGDLVEIADALFGQDPDLILKLPDGYAEAKPVLVGIMHLAYAFKVRPTDVRVDLMY